MSIEEYLAAEKAGLVRNEYVSGEIYAMAGASDRHHRICLNLVKMLDDHLQEGDCDAFMTEIKVKADEETFYYPDVFVACDKNPKSPYYREEPVLVIEVVSPSTRQIDRREKLRAYRQIPSVKEYAIIEQDKMHIELHRRLGDSWVTYYYSDTERQLDIDFQSINILTNIDAIYSRVRFPDPGKSASDG